MHTFIKYCTRTTCAFLLFVLAHNNSVQAQDIQAQTANHPAPQAVTISQEIRTQDVPQQDVDTREAGISDHHRPGFFTEVTTPQNLQDQAPSQSSMTPLPQSISVLINRALTDFETNNSTSTVGEPSLAYRGNEVLVTGNWYASFSTDGGSNFSFVNPFNSFPTIPGQGFCCDQVAIYDPGNDVMIWYLQYINDSNGNTGRIAVAQGSDIASQQWRIYDLTPQNVGGWNQEWFDYPAITVSNDFLYFTTNMFSTTANSYTRTLGMRIPLTQLANYQPLSFDFFDTNTAFSLRPTRGAVGTMHFGSTISNTTLRILTWPENSLSISVDDVAIQFFSNAQRVAPGPDGRDWLGRADQRINGGWKSGNQLGFAWTAAQDANFPFPHVRVAVVDANTRALLSQPHLWNPDFAYAYPATSPNGNGTVGISVSFGGNQLFPSQAVGWFDSASGTWNLQTAASGTDGPSANRWGDYFDVHADPTQNSAWVATGFTLENGPDRTDVVPRFIKFDTTGVVNPPDTTVSIDIANLNPGETLTTGETLTVQATVAVNGSPAAGKTVTFSSSNPAQATVSPASGTTNASGQVNATVEGQTDNSGSVDITATSEGESATTTVQVPDMSLIAILVLLAGLLAAGAYRKRYLA